MLVQINQTDNFYIEEFLKGLRELNFHFYASEIQQTLGLYSLADMEEAVRRAMNSCRSQQFPLHEHFKPVYRCQEKKVILDWKLSELAYCLVLMNSDPAHPAVSQFQFTLLRKKTAQEKY